MQIFATIAPIFTVIALGYIARVNRFMPKEFLGPANRIVFYLALPTLVFHAVSKASFQDDFNSQVLFITLSATVLIYCAGWLITLFWKLNSEKVGAFIVCGGHGNQAYVGIPIAFFFLGDNGFAKAAILAGFIFITQNMLSVLVMQAKGVAVKSDGIVITAVVKNLISNPIIVAAFLGMIVILTGISLPAPVNRFLDIMSGLAAPMSLLLIGASLSFTLIRKNFFTVFGVVAIKLILLPLLGLIPFLFFGLQVDDYLPALILLAAPTATVAYVLAGEMGGDQDIAAAAISASTISSAATYVLWLTIAS